MARISYLIRRGASYSARVRVPVDLVSLVGRNELVKALGTNDEREAKNRLWPVVNEWLRQFEDLRLRRALTPDDKADAVWRHYSEGLERDELARQHMPTPEDEAEATRGLFEKKARSELDQLSPIALAVELASVKVATSARAFDANARRVKLKTLRQHLVQGETVLVEDELNDYLDQNKLLVDRSSIEYRDLLRQVMRAEIERLERTLERDAGDYSGSPKDPIVRPAASGHREQAKAGETIMELFEIYARENPKGISADTLNQARRDIGTFVETVGRTCPVNRIDKRAVRDWKALLVRYPVKATETKAFGGMTIAQAVRENEKIGKPVLTPRTVNRYLAGLGAFSAWLVSHGYLNANPVEGMSLAKKKERSTSPFTTEQLNTLFASPLFTGAQSATEWRSIAKAGDVLIRDHRYWVPLVMLYSGARPAEIAQLTVSDVRAEHDVWIMHITTEGDGNKRVKTAGSMRIVPIHSELIRLGFLKHHEKMKATGQAQLFPEAKRNSRGQMIAEFSREFGRYLERIGMKEGRGLSLYSFRHGAVDALRRAGYLDEQFGFLFGHTKGTMTGRYGNLPQGMLQQRIELVEAIAYPGLRITHLSAAMD